MKKSKIKPKELLKDLNNKDWPSFIKTYYHADTILRANGELWICNEIKTVDYVEI